MDPFKIPSIDEHECLDFLSQLVQHKSYSETPGEREITAFVAAAMRTTLGLSDAATVPFPDNPSRQNAIGTWHGTGGGKRLLFNGHLDTNPVGGGWTIDPWAGAYDDEFIYGIGVSNMKAGCAAYFMAVKTLQAAGWRPKGDVVLTFVVGELQGGVGTVALIDQGRCDAVDYFVNCEPTDIRAITMHAESLVFEIELLGETRHMSAREEAVDAILASCKLVPRLTAMKFHGALSEEHERINRCHVGVLHGALGRELAEWRPPQVADYVRLLGSARYAPGQSQEGVLADLRAEIEGLISEGEFSGLGYTLKPVDHPTMPAFQVSKDARIVTAVNEAYKGVRGDDQPTGALPPSCFYGSDAGHLYQRLGLQGVVCGPGGRYNTRPDEKVDIVDYLDCVRMFVRLIVDVCG